MLFQILKSFNQLHFHKHRFPWFLFFSSTPSSMSMFSNAQVIPQIFELSWSFTLLYCRVHPHQGSSCDHMCSYRKFFTISEDIPLSLSKVIWVFTRLHLIGTVTPYWSLLGQLELWCDQDTWNILVTWSNLNHAAEQQLHSKIRPLECVETKLMMLFVVKILSCLYKVYGFPTRLPSSWPWLACAHHVNREMRNCSSPHWASSPEPKLCSRLMNLLWKSSCYFYIEKILILSVPLHHLSHWPGLHSMLMLTDHSSPSSPCSSSSYGFLIS